MAEARELGPYVGKKIVVVQRSHPHFKCTGRVEMVDEVPMGIELSGRTEKIGLRVTGIECSHKFPTWWIFEPQHILVLHEEEKE